MKTSGILVFLCLLSAGTLLVSPADADLMIPTITHVYFEKDGGPYHGSAEYTVTCFGYRYHFGDSPSEIYRAPGTYQPGSVFSYSATYPDYGGTIYEPYYTKYTHIDWCDIRVTTGNTVYTVRNFSTYPYSHCTKVPYPVEGVDNLTSGQVYYWTAEYTLCNGLGALKDRPFTDLTVEKRVFITCEPGEDPGCFPFFSGYRPVREHSSNLTKMSAARWQNLTRLQFLQYIESCDPVSDPSCGGWTVDGTPVKNLPGLRPFRDIASSQGRPCDTFLISASRDLMVPEEIITSRWFDNEYLASEVCELRVAIPYGNGEPVQTAAPLAPGTTVKPSAGSSPSTTLNGGSVSPENARSPVESLYCGIIELLGGKCG